VYCEKLRPSDVKTQYIWNAEKHGEVLDQAWRLAKTAACHAYDHSSALSQERRSTKVETTDARTTDSAPRKRSCPTKRFG
jgi:hypothetical protein